MLSFRILDFDELDSTNEHARKMIKEGGSEEGLVIKAAFQRKGKGQQSNRWESGKGENLLFSLILHPEFVKASDAFLISQFISLSVAEFIKKRLNSDHVRIKWPNDIYLRDEKVAGILIENDISNVLIQSIIGIGLNVNQTKFPDSLPNPVSMRVISGIEEDINEMLRMLLVSIDKFYHQLKSGNQERIRMQYNENLYRSGIKSSFRDQKGKVFAGKICGVTEEGKLIIDTENGTLFFDFKEVEFMIS